MANGNFAGGSGTVDNPYLIEDAYDLNAIRNKVRSTHYKLINDIDMNVSPYNTGEGFTPIPNVADFSLDGQFFKIENLYINRPSTSYVGLFSGLNNSSNKVSVLNLRLKNAFVSGLRYVGGLVGNINYGVTAIKNVTVEGYILGDTFETGGIIGSSNSDPKSSILFENCSFIGKVESNSYVGGLFGGIDTVATIKNCYVQGEVKGRHETYSRIGGLIGQVGLSGVVEMINCYSASTIIATSSSVTNSIIGDNRKTATSSNTFFDYKKSGISSAGVTGAIGKSTQEMYGSSTYARWDKSIWVFNDEKYPILFYQKEPANKTLILHDGEYKNLKQKESNFIRVSYPKKPLLSHSDDDMVISASRERAGNPAYYATSDRSDFWFSNLFSSNWLKIKFKKPKRIVEIKLSSPTYSGSDHCLRNWAIYASNDDISYTLLYTGIKQNNALQETYDINNKKSYLYYKFDNMDNHRNGKDVGMNKLVLVEEYQEFPKTWSVVSSTLPTSEQFIDEGHDDLSIFNREVTTLFPVAMENTVGILPPNTVSKVFRKILDLNKYMDLRGIKVEVKK